MPARAEHKAYVVYLDSATATTELTPYYRSYDGASWIAQTAMASTGTGGAWYVVKPNPARNEMVMAFQDANLGLDKIYLQVWNGSTWGSQLALDQDASAAHTQRNFDVAVEQNSGNVWVIYRSVSSTSIPYAYKWNGTSWTSQGAVSSGWTGTIQWIRLEAKPSSNELMLIVQASGNSGIWAARYSGTAWDASAKQLETSGPPIADTTQSFDVAYERNTGNCVVLWVQDGTGSTDVFRSISFYSSSTAWGSTFTALSDSVNFPPIVDPVRGLMMQANPLSTSNEMIAIFKDDTGSTTDDVDALVWNGSSWTARELSNNADNVSVSVRSYCVAYDAAGTGYAMYNSQGTVGTPNYRTYTTTGGWAATASSFTSIGASDALWMQAEGNPQSGSTSVMVVTRDNAATAVTKAQLLGGATVEIMSANGGGATAPSMAITWKDGTAPAAPASPVATAGDALVDLNWTANTEADLKDYRIYRSTNGNATVGSSWTITLATILSPGTTHRDPGLTNLATYYYKLDARDTSLNASALSVEVSTWPRAVADTTPPATPTGLTLGDPGTTALNLNWTANTEVDMKDYRVHRSTNAGVVIGGTQTVVIATIAFGGTTHQDPGGLTAGRWYYYKLTARDASTNESGGSSEVSGAPGAPATPTGFALADPGTTALNLSWTANTEDDRKDYRVYRSTNAGVTIVSSHVVTAIASPGTTHQDGGLTSGTRYNYRLTARDVSLNESGGAAEISGVPGAPAAPSGLAAADAGGDQGTALNLTWTANTEGDMKDYRIFRSTNGNVTVGSSWTVTLAAVAFGGTTHQDAGLTPVTTYYFKITARDTTLNESAASGEVNARPQDNLAPAAPGGLTVGDPGTTVLNLNWTVNTESDVREYLVYRSTNTGVTLVSTHVVVYIVSPGTTDQDAGLTTGRRYNYKVTARDNSTNESAGSSEASGVPGAPAAPTGLGVGDPGTTVLNLSWAANTEADLKDYRVFRSTNGNVTIGSSWTATMAAIAAPGTTYQDAGGLTVGTRYFYRITARDAGPNESVVSSELSGVPGAPAAPTGVGIADVPGDQGFALQLSWNANTEADLKDYRVLRATSNPYFSSVDTARIAAPGTTHQDAGLTNGSTYYYVIFARDASLNEGAGSPLSPPVYPQDNLAPGVVALPGVADAPGDQGTALNLSWAANAAPDLKDYRVYRSTNNLVTVGSTWTITLAAIAQPGTTHQDTGLTPVTTYYYKVTARDVSLNESSASTEVNLRPSDNLAPTAPAGLTVGDPGTTVLNLNWTVNTESDVREYLVYRSTNTGVTLVSTHVVVYIVSPGTTDQDAGLTTGRRYNYKVTARDNSTNESAGSSEASGVPGAPAAPTGLGVGDPGTTVLNLSWAANTEADLKDYRVYRSTNAGVTQVSSHVVTNVATPGTTHQDGNVVVGTRYNYRLSGRDTASNESGLSSEVSGVAGAPAAPAGLGTADVAADQGTALNLSWIANTEADLKDYRVFRSTNGNVTVGSTWTVTLATLSQPGTTHQDVGLTPVTTYFYKVTARDGSANESSASSEVNLRPVDNLAPAAPGAPTVADVPADQGFALRLNWTLNTETDVREYGVYRSTNGNVTLSSTWTVFLGLAASPGTTRQDGGLTNAATYYYKLSARDTSGNESGLSAEASGIPTDNLAPATPTGLGVGDPGTTVLNLSWTANTETDLKDYRLYRSTNAGVTQVSTHVVTTIATPGTTHQDGNVVVGTRYNYRLSSRDTGSNESGLSSEVFGVPGAPAAPAGLGVGDPGTTVLNLSWTANTEGDFKDYRIHRSTNAGVVVGGTQTVALAVIATPGTTHQDAAGLTAGRWYYYKITARDTSSNESGGSSEASGAPGAPAAPTGLGAGDVPADQGFALRLSWAANTEADTKDYRIWRSTNGNVTVPSSWTALLGIVGPGTTHQDGGLVNGATYYYKIDARDTALNLSPPSTQASAIPYDNLAPAAPAAPGVDDVPADQGFALRLSWTANTESDLKDYRVLRATSNPYFSSVITATIASPGTTHQDGGLTNGSTYYYVLTARDASLNESGPSPGLPGAFPVDNLAPAAPGAPTVADVPADQGFALRLNWTLNTETDVREYGIYRSTNGNGTLSSSWTVLLGFITSPGTTHQDGGLTNAATFYYKLSARDTSGNESGLSGEASALPLDNLAPAIPTGLAVADVPSDQGFALRFSWTANTEADLKSYAIFRATSSLPTAFLLTIAAPGTTDQDAGLSNGATYYYRIRAKDTGGNESGYSAEASAYPSDNLAPAAPAGLGVADAPGDQGFALRLSWTANTEPDLKDYKITRATSNPYFSSVIAAWVVAPGTTHQDGGLTNGSTYYYVLNARDISLNESGASAGLPQAFPQDNLAPAAPTGLGIVDPGTTVLNLFWSANTEADLKDYVVYRSTNIGVTQVSSNSIAAVVSPGTTNQNGDVVLGTRYNYRISARDISSNQSGLSAEVSGVPGAPAPPTGPGVADVAADQGTALNLSWTADTEADMKDYGVYRSTLSGALGSKTLLTRVSALGTTHQDVGLTPVTTYFYQITARDTGGNESGGSSEVNLRPADNLAPSAPGAATVADAPADQGFALRLNWTLNTETDVREYGVYRSTNGNVTLSSSWTALVTLVLSPGTTRQDNGLTNGATYYYKLSARDTSGNESGLSAEGSAIPYDNLAPGTPAGVGVANAGSGAGGAFLNLSWAANNEPDLKDYRVFRSTTGNVTIGSSWTATLAVIAAGGTTHQDGALTVGTTYYFRVSARDLVPNESALSAEVSVFPSGDITPPLVPTGVGVADVGGDQGTALNLSWVANTEADLKDYRLHRSTNGNVSVNSSWTVVAAVIVPPGTTHQNTGLSPATTYYYKVTARDTSLNESGASGEVNARPVDNLAPTAPAAPTVADVPSDQGFALRLNWTLNTETDVREYGVYRSTNNNVTAGSTWTVLTTLVLSPGTTRQDGGLANGATYYYKLSARDTSGNESGLSSEASAIPYDNLAPVAPTGLAATDAPVDQGVALNLAWTANTEADLKDYRVFRSTNGNVTVASTWTVTLATIFPGTTHQDMGLTPVTTYYYKVTARDVSLNESGTSSEVNLRPVDNSSPTAPGAPTVSDVPSDQGFALRLSWANNTETDVREYRVYRSTNVGVTQVSSNVAVTIASPGSTHQDGGLTNGTTFYYRLAARDTSANESGLSSEASSIPYDNTAPAAPSGLGVADVPADQGFTLRLSWTAGTEADLKDYRLYRSTNLGVTQVSSNAVVTIASPGTTHQDGGLTNGTTFYYRLPARDTSGNESGLSTEASAIPYDNLAPAAPVSLAVTDVPGDQGFALRLNWSPNGESDLKDYGVYRATWAGASPAPTPTRISAPGTTNQDGGLSNGTTYYYRLTARDVSLNESSYSSEVSAIPYDNLAPSVPGGLTLGDPGSTVLNLNWTAGTEADLKDYRVYRSTNAGVTLVSSHAVTAVAAPGTTHQDAGLTGGTRYNYRLSARDVSLNESAGSSEISGVPGAPSAPAGLGASNTVAGANAGGRLTLSWTANTEADLKDYGVYRATWAGASPAPTPTRIAAAGTTHQDAGLTNGTTFYYRLTARDASLNESGYSAEVSAYPSDTVVPVAPTGLGVTVVGAVSVNLSWTANTETDLKDYRIRRTTFVGVGIADPVVVMVAAPGTTHQDGGLAQGTTYYYRISARDISLNESGLSSEASGTTTTDTTPPANPAGLGAADATAGGRLNLSWTANTEADLKDYRVYRSTITGVTQVSSHVVTAVTAPGTTHQDGGLANGTTYYYKLSARDTSLNESGLSSQASASPSDVIAPGSPAGLGASNSTGGAAVGGRLSLSWSANTESDLKDYRIFRGTFSGVLGTKSVLATIAPPGTTHQDPGLTNGTTSYYQLTARDASGNESGGSSQASAYAADSTAPGVPAGLGVANPAIGLRLNVSWTANTETDLKDYRIFRSTNGNVTIGSSWTVTLAAIVQPGTTHQDAGLANGTTYFYRLTARDATTNESGLSSEVSGTPTDITAPASPTGLAATDAPGDQGVALRLNWTANTETDLKDYRLWRGAASGGIGSKSNIAILAAPGTAHQDGGLAAGTTYYFQITARDQTGNESVGSGEISGYPQDNVAPSSPTAFGVAVVSSGTRLNLSWAANTEADLKDYRAWRGLASGSLVTKSSIAAVAVPGTTHQDGGLANGTTYYYQVTARDVSFNESVGSTEQSATPQDVTAPAAPAGLGAAFSGIASRINLSWTANTEPDLKDYRVYRSTNLGVTIVSTHAITAIAPPGTTHQDGGLGTTTYYYRLTARDITGNESGGSGEASANTTDVTAPANPLGLGVADVPGDQGGALRVSWTANTEADLKDYRAWRGAASGGIGTKSIITVIAAPGTTHQDAGLVNGTTYYYQLTARDTSGNESAGGSGEASAYPSDNIAPGMPTGLGVAAVVSGTLRLSWTTNTEGDLKDYRLWRATLSPVGIGGAFSPAAVVASPGTTHQDGGLTKGTTYYYRLTARDTGLNESGGSTEVSGAPPLIAVPAGLAVSDPGTGPLNLSWTANTETDLKDYRLYRSTNTGVTLISSHVVTAVAAPGTTHQDGGLTAGTRYNYRMTARDLSLNESGLSGETAGQPGAPAAPTLLGVADAGTGSGLNLSWAASPEIDLKDYRLYRSTSGNVTAGSSWTVVAATVAAPGTTQQDGGLASGTTYAYRLSARDIGLNESPLSSQVSGIPAAPATVVTPSTPTAPPTTAVTATVSVSAPSGSSAELKTVLEPGKASRIDGNVVTLKSTGAVPGDTIEVRIVNTKTNATQTVSVKVDAQGNWSVPTPKLADGMYEIQVRQVDPATNLASAWSPDKPFVVVVDAVPDQTVTIPAGPNPFRPGRGASLAVGFELQEAANVTVSIHTTDGALVKTLVDERALGPGKYERGPAGDTAAGWDGTNESGQVVSSGIYLIKVKIGDRVNSRKILLIR